MQQCKVSLILELSTLFTVACLYISRIIKINKMLLLWLACDLDSIGSLFYYVIETTSLTFDHN